LAPTWKLLVRFMASLLLLHLLLLKLPVRFLASLLLFHLQLLMLSALNQLYQHRH